MNLNDMTLQKKKTVVVLLHILFLVLALTGISTMYLNSHFGKGLSWLTHETYEDTPVFTRQLKNDIDEIFNYVNYKEVFETDKKLDVSKPIVTVETGPGESKTYTLDEMIRYGKSRGLYLNEKFKLTGPMTGVQTDANELRVEWRAYDPNLEYSEPGDSNAYATLDALSEEVLTNLGNYYSFYYKFIQNPSNLQFRVFYQNTSEDSKLYTNTANTSIEAFKSLGRYLYVTGDSVVIDSNLNAAPKNITSLLETNNPYDNSNYYMIVAVDTSYPYSDAYSQEAAAYNQMRLTYIMGLISLGVGLLGCLVTLYYLIVFSGRRDEKSREIYLHSFDRVSTETGAFLCLVAILCAIFAGEKIGYRLVHLMTSEVNWEYFERLLRSALIYGVCIVGAFSLLRRYKARTIWKNSLLKKVADSSALYFDNHDFTIRLVLCYVLFLAANIILIGSLCFLFYNNENLLAKILFVILAFLFVCLDFWVFHQLFKNAAQTDKINEAVFKISAGDTTYKIDIDGFSGKEQTLAENINHISSGLETALQEQVKSERLKADLITNVSHDIKTPLTSIINYVDLIKREHIQDEKILGYLEVLDQKSQRLKTLTEDLVEASKASSGNLKLDIMDIDFVELVQQTNGEFEEKFAMRHLDVVAELPEEVIIIQADGRSLWRVLENLYNNAFKYAMEHSRIYISMEREDGCVSFTIKNISENSLNIQPEELTERFVRGDVARTTEGSGLGLSIAKSLTELQGGSFDIYIDGDLFKVRITFPIKVNN